MHHVLGYAVVMMFHNMLTKVLQLAMMQPAPTLSWPMTVSQMSRNIICTKVRLPVNLTVPACTKLENIAQCRGNMGAGLCLCDLQSFPCWNDPGGIGHHRAFLPVSTSPICKPKCWCLSSSHVSSLCAHMLGVLDNLQVM